MEIRDLNVAPYLTDRSDGTTLTDASLFVQ